ncbi:hypothetical protein MNBD_CHLOROFLEXI01-4799 [hydrothermal vent metagenome]|uniref:Uncharacterized protein n=1 Tax=hydrothermal vent metagenome TaxID=652676 RepID=A0A3B0V2U4_9ZZZZ
MLTWLKQVLGISPTLDRKKTPLPMGKPIRETAVPPPTPPPAQPTPSGQDHAQQFLEKLQEKIGRLADDFANGSINQQQFQKLYAHYQREMRTVETLIETDQSQSQWGDAFQEGESVLIRQKHAAKAKGYAIYDNNSGMPISTLGKFEVDPALFVPMLSAFRSAMAEIFGGGIQSTAIEGGRWLCFVPSQFTTMMALFTAEPANKQIAFLEQLHSLFEKANRALLPNSPIEIDDLVFPHEHFLGKWKR